MGRLISAQLVGIGLSLGLCLTLSCSAATVRDLPNHLFTDEVLACQCNGRHRFVADLGGPTGRIEATNTLIATVARHLGDMTATSSDEEIVIVRQEPEKEPRVSIGRVLVKAASVSAVRLPNTDWLRDLVRVQVLESSPGAGGGFRLARSAKKIRLSEIFAPFEPILANRRPCPFGQEVCSDDDPCAGHDQWKHVRETYGRFLEKNSVYDVAFTHRKRRSAKAPRRTKR